MKQEAPIVSGKFTVTEIIKGQGIKMTVVERSWEVQKNIEDRVKKVGKGKYGRVFRMARKPNSEEYVRVIEITGLGLLAIGALGFLIYWIWTYLPGYFG